MVSKANQQSFFIPEICKNTSLLITIVLVALAAIICALVFNADNLAISFSVISLYLLWTVLLAIFIICRSRNWISKQGYLVGFLTALFICLLAFTITELVAQYSLLYSRGMPFQLGRFARLLLAATIVSLLILRFFSVLNLLENRNKSEAQSRMQALQSRIQPHFLFNCLNTISELTATKPDQAEEAIDSLSKLLRASMDESTNKHPLLSEIRLCERYLELEKWRLGDSLTVTWKNGIEKVDNWFVPKLILQPLVENAVVHGRDENGVVEILIDIKETAKHLSIMVVNQTRSSLPNIEPADNSKNNGLALNNIRERLFVLYDDQQIFKVRNDGTSYAVIMRIPKETM